MGLFRNWKLTAALRKILPAGLALCLLPHCLWDIDDPENLLQNLLNGRYPLMFTVLSENGGKGREIEDLLTGFLLLPARSTVRCSFEDVNAPGVLDALFSAQLRGIDIKIGLDEDSKWGIGYTALASYLQTASGDDQRLFLGNAGTDKQVSLNLCVADDTRVWVATAPPTALDLSRATAFGMYFQSPDDGLARKFKDELDLITHGAFGSAKQQRNRRNHWLIQDIDVGAYTAPADDPVEGFMVKRVIGAKDNIRLFSTTWFSNELDSNDLRETNDLAHEIRANKAGFKEVMVSGYADQASDPDAASGLNSMAYMRANGGATRYVLPGQWGGNGLNLLITDQGQKGSQVFVSSAPFAAATDSSHDGVLFVFEDDGLVNRFTDFYEGIKSKAILFPEGQSAHTSTTGSREVVISEILWSGGYNLDQTSRDSEYFELYNTTNRTLNISGWKFQCKTTGAFTSTDYTIPDRTFIAPGEFLLFSDTSSIVIDAFTTSSMSIASTVTQCRLIDGATTVVDLAGDGLNAFDDNDTVTGRSDAVNFIRSSMERITLTSAGDDLLNWHTAIRGFETNYNFVGDFAHRTFGTPGYGNSAPPATAAQATVLINEIKVGNAPPEDYVELYVVAGGSMGGWKLLDQSTTRYTFDESFTVQTGDLIVIHYDSANQGTFANEDNAGSTINESAGTDSVATAYDVYILTTTQTGTDSALLLTNALGQVADSVPYSDRSTAVAASVMTFWATMDGSASVYKWDWAAVPVDGVNDTASENESVDVSNAALSSQRDSNYLGGGIQDTNTIGEWCQSGNTMGTTNADC